MSAVGTLYGVPVRVTPDRPRYQMPEEVMTGVPWPAGFRDRMNRDFVKLCGVDNFVPDGEAVVMVQGFHSEKIILMNPRTWRRLINETAVYRL